MISSQPLGTLLTSLTTPITLLGAGRHEFQKSNDAKSFWSTVKKFQGKTKSTNIGTLIHDNKPVTSNIDKANTMNNFFSTVGKNLAESLSQITSKTPQPNSTNFTHIYQITPTVCEINLDENKFEKTFKSTVKVGKASGPDDISPTDLKLCEEESIRSLQKVIKKSIDWLKFPKPWKIAKVSCIYKKGIKSSCSNYRPISLLSICLLYTSPSPRDGLLSRMPSSA